MGLFCGIGSKFSLNHGVNVFKLDGINQQISPNYRVINVLKQTAFKVDQEHGGTWLQQWGSEEQREEQHTHTS